MRTVGHETCCLPRRVRRKCLRWPKHCGDRITSPTCLPAGFITEVWTDGYSIISGSPRRREIMEMLGVKELRIIPAKGGKRCPARLPRKSFVPVQAKAEEVAARVRR